MMRTIEKLMMLQEHILETGLARSIVATAAPRMLGSQSPTSDLSEQANVFSKIITEPEIRDVSYDLFSSGHYNLSVAEAFKAVEKFISSKVPHLTVTGTSLMDQALSANNPEIFWSERKNQSQIDEQKGYQRLYSGSILGIRNPTTHEFNWVEDPDLALELVIFAQHLIRKAKTASVK